MKITIALPHYKTGKMTACSIYRFLKFKGNHDLRIIVIDNNSGDGSIDYLKPFEKYIEVVNYPKDKMQSHGIAFDYIISMVDTDYIITVESDSMPVNDEYLNSIETLINLGYDAGGSLLKLSGGEYLHPCGAFYNVKMLKEAQQACDEIRNEYSYFSNIYRRDGFDYHLMVHKNIMESFTRFPEQFIELSDPYKDHTQKTMLDSVKTYETATNVFHNGQGFNNENIVTYGYRNIQTEKGSITLPQQPIDMIRRVGYEPGQWLSYWMEATKRRVVYIPTDTKWMPNRENQQQDHTLMGSNFIHLWGVTAYHDVDSKEFNDIVSYKNQVVDDLYNSLPDEVKIKLS